MVLGRPVLLAGVRERSAELAGKGAGARVDAQLDARLAQLGQRLGQELVGDAGVYEQRLRGVADGRALHLGVHRDRHRVVEVRRVVDEHVAVARRGVHHRHRGVLLQRRLQPLAPARDDQVDHAILRRDLAQLVAVAAVHDRDRAVGHAGAAGGGRGHLGEHGVRLGGGRRAAQHDRVARLEAERGAVDGHVRARLVHHGHHAEGHPNAPHVEPVLEPVPADRLAHGVGQRDDRAHVVRDPGEPLLGELQAVEQTRVQAGVLPRLHVARVGLEDLRGAQLERVRHRLERAVLGGGVEPRQLAGGALRARADVRDGFGDGGHSPRVSGALRRARATSSRPSPPSACRQSASRRFRAAPGSAPRARPRRRRSRARARASRARWG